MAVATFFDATHVEETNAYVATKQYSAEVFAPSRTTDSKREYQLKHTKTILLSGSDAQAKRQEILRYFHDTYDIYEKLFEPLSEKSFYMRADPLRHPLIFYYGHTACFFINKLRLAKVVKARVNKRFESMFAVGVDEMSWDDLLPDNYDWPSVTEVKQYRDQVRAVVEEAIIKTPLTLPITWESPFWAVLMGIEHERIHFETSTVLMRQLPLSVIKTHPFWEPCRKARSTPASVPRNELLPVISQPVAMRLGKPFDHKYYGWDNEYGVQESTVPAFSASKFIVTNAEFLAFVEDGGYQNKMWWTDEGWKWAKFRCKTAAESPRFWVRRPAADGSGQVWKLRLMLEEVDMPWDWPAEVNYLEAKAFCNWLAAKTGKNIRLPMEDEYEVLRRREIEVDYPNWTAAPGNVNMEYYSSSTPVDMFPATPGGFYDVIGNVWQHCETPIDGFKGFKVHPLYDDFSVPTFDQKHNLLRGSSWVSTGNEATLEARYAFRRHFYQHAGFRYIESDRKVEVSCDQYERDENVAQSAYAHYGPEQFGVPNFARALAQFALAEMKGRATHRALDLGCSTGRSSFELAHGFDSVLGLDFSTRFIRLAVQLKQERHIKYSVVDEGELYINCTHALSELKLEDTRDKVEFFQSDANNLAPKYSNYDLILCPNLLERLSDPRQFLATIHERIVAGGLLILASTYAWSENVTPKELWLSGFVESKTGKEVRAFDAISDILSPHFKLARQPASLPFILRETRRKFQHCISEVTVWEKL